MLDDYVIDLDDIVDSLGSLSLDHARLRIAIDSRDFEEAKEYLARLGGTIAVFQKEFGKLLLPNPILKLRGDQGE